MSDLQELDRKNRETWQRAAWGWEKRQVQLREMTAPVSRWMVDAIDPQPGQRILELAAGPGETGFLAAQRIGPTGRLISSDQSQEMVDVARRRAAELGLKNTEFVVLEAQRLELPAASVDGVLCRWGYMLMADPDTALRRTRAVLRAGGRLALAAWDTPDRNLWMSAPAIQLAALGALEPPNPGDPSPFAMADSDRLAQRLGDAGFAEIRVEKVEFQQSYKSFEQYWEINHDLSAPLAAALDSLGPDQVEEVQSAVRGVLSQFTAADGSMSVPASTVVASGAAEMVS